MGQWGSVLLALMASCGGTKQPNLDVRPRGGEPCPVGELVRDEDGVAKIALLVGVSEYRSDAVTDLQGPRIDLATMTDLLTNPATGYGFPRPNVCVLEDATATHEGVEAAFRQALIDRAKPGDLVVFYFAGHGAQVSDQSGDEVDRLDETFVLHDSRVEGRGDLRDDVVSGWLRTLADRTRGDDGESNIVVVLDSCHSGTAAKGDLTVRSAPRDHLDADENTAGDVATDRVLPPGITQLSAATAKTLAMETEAGGMFTQSLLDVLGPIHREPLTWSQVARRLEVQLDSLTSARQHPAFEGRLDRVVFGGTERIRPLGWEVVEVDAGQVVLEGALITGWQPGAQARIWPGTLTGGDAVDPAKSVAVVEVFDRQTMKVWAKVVEGRGSAIQPGDRALLAVPATSKLPVRLDPSLGDDATAFRDAIAEQTVVAQGMDLDPTAPDRSPFTVARQGAEYVLRGPEGRSRFYTRDLREVIERLDGFARQQPLLTLQGEPGPALENDASLAIRLIPSEAGNQSYDCGVEGMKSWVPAEPNTPQIAPLCTSWEVEIENTTDEDLFVGGVILYNDGQIDAFPNSGDPWPLGAHDKQRIPRDGRWLQVTSTPPLGIPEVLIAVGTRQHVNWSGYAIRGSKDVKPSRVVDESWTTSRVTFTAVPNAHFASDDAVSPKEFTVRDFNLDPYLPDPTSPLHDVLMKADELARTAGQDGVPYRQHAWNQGTGRATVADDALNLARGIDCSRAIWWAFTRAGLPYTSSTWHDGYLSTAQMFDDDGTSCLNDVTPLRSPMNDHFDSCLGASTYQTGDVLVYQGPKPLKNGKTRCVGHTVMVIDPDQFVAWGSHGWDGATKRADWEGSDFARVLLKDDEGNVIGMTDVTGREVSDTGVEYQKILRGSWAVWDRNRYQLKACWRHRAFTDPRPVGDALRSAYCRDSCIQRDR